MNEEKNEEKVTDEQLIEAMSNLYKDLLENQTQLPYDMALLMEEHRLELYE